MKLLSTSLGVCTFLSAPEAYAANQAAKRAPVPNPKKSPVLKTTPKTTTKPKPAAPKSPAPVPAAPKPAAVLPVVPPRDLQLEARVAREYQELDQAGGKATMRGQSADRDLSAIAIDLARLGKVDEALEIADFITSTSPGDDTSKPRTRGEVLRLVVHRRCLLGDVTGANALLSQMEPGTKQNNAMLAIAVAEIRRGNKEAASSLLWKVAAAVKTNKEATSAIAYLVGLTGDKAGAKRLFATAVDGVNALAKNRTRDYMGPDEEIARQNVGRFLLQAGLADEFGALQYPLVPDLYDSQIEQLIALGRADVALRVARASLPTNKIVALSLIAAGLAGKPAERKNALAAVTEAEAVWRTLLPPSEARSQAGTTPQQQSLWVSEAGRDYYATHLIAAYRALGQEAGAKKLLTEVTTGQSEDRAAYVHFLIALRPFHDRFGTRQPLAGPALATLQPEITPLLPKLGSGFESLMTLTREQIKAKQFKAALVNLPYLEKFYLSSLDGPQAMDKFNDAVQVARMWRDAGDETRCMRLLAELGSKQHLPDLGTLERADLISSYGFEVEAQQMRDRVHGAKPGQYEWSRARREALARPEAIPAWITAIKQPDAKLRALRGFTEGLTWDLFNNEEEQKIPTLEYF